MTAAQVARQLDVSRARVHELDAALEPVRCACTRRARRYDPARVAAYVANRPAARAALTEARRTRMLELRRRIGM